MSSSRRTILGESILATVYSSYIYFAAFSYEEGFLSYYHIQPEFIEVTIERIFLLLICAIASLGLLVFILNPFVPAIIKLAHKYKNRLPIIMPFIIYFLTLLILVYLQIGFKKFVSFAIGSGILTILPTLLASLFHKGSLIERLEGAYKADEHIRDNDIISYMTKTIGHRAFLKICIAAFFILFCNLLGYSNAKNKTEYLATVIDKTNYLVVRNYNNKQILVEYDSQDNAMVQRFKIIGLDDLKNHTYSTIRFKK